MIRGGVAAIASTAKNLHSKAHPGPLGDDTNKPPVVDKSPTVQEIPVASRVPAVAKSPVVQVSELSTHSSSGKSGDEADKTPEQTQQRSPGLVNKESPKEADPNVSLDAILHGKGISLSGTLGSSDSQPLATLANPAGQHLKNGNGSMYGGEDAVPDSPNTATPRQSSSQLPKQRGIMRVSSTSSSILGRRTMSTETNATTIVGRMATSTNITALRALPIEERLAKAHSCLKELQYACGLHVHSDRADLQRVLDLVDKIRMRQVPRQWSPLDRRLKLIQCSAERIAGFVSLVKDRGSSDAEGAAAMIMSCCEITLQGEPVLSSLSLDSLLSILHRVGAILQRAKLAMPAEAGKSLDSSSQKLYAALVMMTHALQRISVSFVEMLDQARETGKSLTLAMFTYQINKYFEADIANLSEAAGEACQQVWQLTYKDSTVESSHACVTNWLDDQIDCDAARGHPGHRHGFSRDLPLGDEATPFVFDFVESLVLKLFKTPQRILIVTGEIGYGEQELASNLLERLQLTLTVGSKLLHGSFASSRGTTSGTVGFLKSLLRQMLDQSVGNTSFISALYQLAKRTVDDLMGVHLEDRLWELLTEECSRAKGNVLIVIDRVAVSESASSVDSLLTELQKLTSKCHNVRVLSLVTPTAAHSLSDVEIYTLTRAIICRNARLFLVNAIAASASLSVLSTRIRRELLQHIADKQWTSMLEAKLTLRLLESEKDVTHMPDIIRETPKTFQGLLDYLILKIDYKNPEMQTLLSWLLVGKRSVDVMEIEKQSSLSVSNWLRRIRSGRAVSFNSYLSSVLTIRNGCIEFVDSQVKARMQYMSLHERIPLSLNVSHRQVLLACLRHARDALAKTKVVDIDFQDPTQTRWASKSEYMDFDSMFWYAARHWHGHYEKSLTPSEKLTGRVPADVALLLPDSVLMTFAEWNCLRVEYTNPLAQEKALLQLLDLRKSAFGPKSPSVIQTTIILAHYDSTVALERLIEAFEGVIATCGDPSPQATSGAKYISTLVKLQNVTSLRVARVFKYLYGVYRRELGDSHEETLTVGMALASLYKTELAFTEASEVLLDIYNDCSRTKGLFATATLEAFQLLIDTLEQSDRMTDAQQLCQDLFEAAQTLETWNETVLQAVTRIVPHYQERGMSDVSAAKLRQLWHLLLGQFKKRSIIGYSSVQSDLFVSLTSITLKFSLQLRDLALDAEVSEAIQEYWVLAARYLTSDRKTSTKVLVQLREMSQILLRIEKHKEALTILRVLYDIHQTHSIRDHSPEEMLIVYTTLIACYKAVDNSLEDFPWLNILDSILAAKGGITDETVLVCRELAALHRSRSQHAAAISICQKALSKLWPAILEGQRTVKEDLSLPDRFLGECVQMVVIMAQMYKLAGDEKRCKDLVKSVVYCCRRRILPFNTLSESRATTLSLALEEAGMHSEALHFWRSLLSECQETLDHSHRFTMRVATVIARLSLLLAEEDDFDNCDDHLYKDFLELEPDENDLDSILMLIEALFALCKLHGDKDRQADVLKWYERLWSYYFDLRNDLTLETSRGFEIFQGYCSTLIAMKNLSVAVRLARNLRSAYLTDFGREDIWTLKVSLELAALLETDKGTIREAAELYDEIKEICLGIFEPAETILLILTVAQERLGVLVSTEPAMHDRAEQILLKGWKQAHERYGYSHEQSIISIQKLLDFCSSSQTAESLKTVTGVLQEAVLGVLGHEISPQKLFKLSYTFVSMYQSVGLTYHDLTFLPSVRAGILRSETEETRVQEGFYDRRCLILVYGMEALFGGDKASSVSEEVFKRVLTETALYEAWLRACLGSVGLDDLLNSGTRLTEYLECHGQYSEAVKVESEAWAVFCKLLGKPKQESGAMYKLFRAIFDSCRKKTAPHSLLESILVAVEELAATRNHKACISLSRWVYKNTQSFRKSSDDSAVGLLLFKLSTLLYACVEVEMSKDLSASIEELATMLGVTAITCTEDLSVVSVSHISLILNIAGREKDYKTLRRILNLLWTSRNGHEFHFSATTTIAIGKRLAEVDFVCGEYSAAFSLLEDISYNLKDVYGVNHPEALSCQALLASMHESLGHRKATIDIRFAMLRDALVRREAEKSREVQAGGPFDESVSIYIRQLRSLKYDYVILGDRQEDNGYASQHLEQNKEALTEILGGVTRLMGGRKNGHQTEGVLDISSWEALYDPEAASDKAEIWSEPKDWSLEMVMDEIDCDSSWSVSDA